MTKNTQKILRLIIAGFFGVFLCVQSALSSSWDPTLLVNTESFQELDEGDGSSDIYVQFGSSLTRQITYDVSANRFDFSDDLHIQGNTTASGSLIVENNISTNQNLSINTDQSGDASITFGNAVNQSISLADSSGTFTFSTGATLEGAVSANALIIDDLINCDTIDTDANGRLTCGNDGQSGSNELSVVQARRTTDFTLTAGYQDLNFDSTDLENNTSVLDHNDTNRDRINIGRDGLYLLSYKVTANDGATTSGVRARVRINDNLTATGSELEATEYQDEFVPTSTSILLNLKENDYVTLQVQLFDANPADLINESTISLVRLEGIQGADGRDGEKGDPGGLANFFDAYDNLGGQLINNAAATTINIDTPRITGTGFTLLLSQIDVTNAGFYEITYSFTTAATANARSTTRAFLERDNGGGYIEIDGSRCWTYSRNGGDPNNTCTRTIILDLDAGDDLRLRAISEDGTTKLTTADGSSITIKRLN